MQHYKIGDLATVISERIENPSKSPYSKFVGLEHYISGEIQITKYGDAKKLQSAVKVFKSGDVLVARRNVYLKRASVVFFDGVTSGDSIVLRPSNELAANLLPYVLNSNKFWEYATRYADGTMSKRLSPKKLLEYEFDLPDVSEQIRLTKILWEIEHVIQKYEATFRMIPPLKQSLIANWSNKYGSVSLKEVATIISGQSPKRAYYNESGNGMPFHQGKTLFGSKYIQKANRWTTKITNLAEKGDILMSVRAPVGPVNIAIEECCIGRGLAIIRGKNNLVLQDYLYYILHNMEHQITSLGEGTTFGGISKEDLQKINIPYPPLEIQQNICSALDLLEINGNALLEKKKTLKNIQLSFLEQNTYV